MKAKLGSLDAVAASKYGSYQALLKKKMIEVINDTKANSICNYILVSGQHLAWGGEKATEDQPLLYLGQTNGWEKEVKANKEMDLKDYSYGTCKLVKVGANVQIALCPEKGKLTQDTLLKPLKKIFKGFKPKTYLEVVSDLNEVVVSDDEDNDTSILDKEDVSGKEALQTIGPDLQKYHVALEKIRDAVESAKTEEEKAPLLVKQNQVLKQLKHLCDSWETDIEPHAAELIVDKQTETWQKIYQKWNTFFDKRAAAKGGETGDQDAVKAQEENIYTKVLKDLNQFNTNLKKGTLIDPSIIEVNINNLEQHLSNWKSFTKDRETTYSKEIKSLENLLISTKTKWSILKPLGEEYYSKKEDLDKAIKEKNNALIIENYNKLKIIYNQISNL